jgi:hypothetical protein
MYYIYHIKGVKIGCSTQPKIRVKRQGYTEYEILETHNDIYKVSYREKELQKEYGYTLDTIPYYMSRKSWGSIAGKSGGKIGGKKSDESGALAKSRNIAAVVNCKPILKFDKNGNFIAEYKSLKEAAKIHNIRDNNISRAANGRRKTCGGYIWKYKD